MNAPADNPRTYKLTIVAPTCFYYQAPLFRFLAADPRIDLTVYFCSDEGISGKDVKAAYGVSDSWGVEDEILRGYTSKLLRNHSPQGSYLKSLIGLANFGIWGEIRKNRPDAVVIMSWMNPTWWLIFLACLRFQIPIFFMTDANFYAEESKGLLKSSIKRNILGKLFFPSASGFLCSGTANRELYSLYGVPNEKLIRFAYSWGYDSMIEKSKKIRHQKTELRRRHGIPEDALVILYCGRLSPEKGSMELMEAYKSITHPKKALVLVGDGALRQHMKDFVESNGLESVYFMGFQTRQEVGQFYALADILVLPSRRDTWGIVINEALCFSLPIVVSDQVGAGVDLVLPGENGHIFTAGNVSDLTDCISKLLDLPEEDRLKMGEVSHNLIIEWSNRDLAAPFMDYLDSIYKTGSDADQNIRQSTRRE